MNFRNTGAADARHPPPATPQLPLARQLSVYSLTFDELQSTLGGPGKDYGSMNMDEFLRNIWTAEESQALASAFGGPSSSSSSFPNPGSGPTSASAAAAALQRQGSLTLPRTLSQKTVDEVWRDLLRESELPQLQQQQQQQQQRQPTLGEMTLEEFLVRAGVVREEIPQQPVVPVQRPAISNNNNNNNNNNGTNTNNIFFGELPNSNPNNSVLGLGFSQSTRPANTTAAMVLPYPAPIDLGSQQGMGDPAGMGNGLVSGIVGLGGGCGVTVAAVGSPDGLGKGNGDLSSLSPVSFSFGAGLRGRKSGAVEKVVERRQRRMIKNRESAARSRARKQAYTMELEAEVAKLKEQNEELQKKQEEIMEIQKNQVMEMINQQHGPYKKMCLRRTQTGPW